MRPIIQSFVCDESSAREGNSGSTNSGRLCNPSLVELPRRFVIVQDASLLSKFAKVNFSRPFNPFSHW